MRRLLVTAAAVVSGLLAALSARAEPFATVVLPPLAEVKTLQPRLGAVVRIESRSASLADSLGRLALPALNPEAPEYTLTRAELDALLARTGYPPGSVALTGHEATTIRFQGTVFTAHECEEFIVHELAARGMKVTLITSRPLPALATPEPDAQLQLAFPNREGTYLPSALILASRGKHLRTVSLRNHLQFCIAALHTAAAVYRGAAALPADFVPREVELAPGAGLLTLPPEPGLQWRIDLPSGVQVLPAYLLAPPLVRRGDQVTVKFMTDAVYLQTNGCALATGARGQKVMVRMPSGETVNAVVAGPGLVIINHPGENDEAA